MSIGLIVGLGNPGPRYEHTRHNAGFWVVDAIAAEYSLSWRNDNKFQALITHGKIKTHECWLMKPQNFMNRSGLPIASLARFYKLTNQQILVIHDDLDLPSGKIKLKYSGGTGGHNGLKDSVSHLGSQDFYRARIGIGHPRETGHASLDVSSYVLNAPGMAEKQLIDDAIKLLLTLVPQIIAGSSQFEQAMQILHKN
jgi:peptidyl-tRNA hydrolase, PTH1 family